MTVPNTSQGKEQRKLAALIASVEMFLFQEQHSESNLDPTRMSAWKRAVLKPFLGIKKNQTPRENWTRLY